jgi:hypothetical protein
MRNFFLAAFIFISTNLFADNHRCEDTPDFDPEICDLFDEASDIFQDMIDVIVVGTVVVGVTAYVIAVEREEIKYDFLADKIIFETGSELDNLEINFSKPFSNKNNKFMPNRFEEHYFGLTWRY